MIALDESGAHDLGDHDGGRFGFLTRHTGTLAPLTGDGWQPHVAHDLTTSRPQHHPTFRELQDLELLTTGMLSPLRKVNHPGSPISAAPCPPI